MTLSIAQGYEYEGNDYWKWWVWLQGTDAELDEVASVEYHLHPTFPKPVHRVTDRASKFRLDASGWGVFHLKAQVEMTDGAMVGLGHMLELAYPDDAGDAVRDKPPMRGEEERKPRRSVFLSAGSADSAVASELRSNLIDRGFEVLSDEDIEPGMSWGIDIDNALKNADAMVAVTSNIASTWVEREVGAATMRGTKVIPIAVGDNPVVPKGLEAVETIKIRDASALGDVAGSIIDALDT
jgi:hypothetical protein